MHGKEERTTQGAKSESESERAVEIERDEKEG
jgi:hypothetical protein